VKLLEDLGMLYPKPNSKQKKRYGLYACPDCTRQVKAQVYQVKTKASTKCRSCANYDKIQNYKHGLSDSRNYRVYAGIKDRCYNKNGTNYDLYGGRGVRMCTEWLDSPEAFMAWAKDKNTEGLEIDKDELSYALGIDPPIYSPKTCQFVTKQRNQEIRKELNKLISSTDDLDK